MGICFSLVLLAPLYVAIRLYNSDRAGKWAIWAGIAWMFIASPSLVAITCCYPKQMTAVIDALVIDVDSCDCVSDRTESPEPASGEDLEGERGPKGDAQKH